MTIARLGRFVRSIEVGTGDRRLVVGRALTERRAFRVAHDAQLVWGPFVPLRFEDRRKR